MFVQVTTAWSNIAGRFVQAIWYDFYAKIFAENTQNKQNSLSGQIRTLVESFLYFFYLMKNLFNQDSIYFCIWHFFKYIYCLITKQSYLLLFNGCKKIKWRKTTIMVKEDYLKLITMIISRYIF